LAFKAGSALPYSDVVKGASVRNLFHRKIFAYVALLFWLFASASGMHGHYCFDGAEPPMSVHFDVLDGHDDHSDNIAGHKDLDTKPSQTIAIKVPSIDINCLSVALLLAIVWPVLRNTHYPLGVTPLTKSLLTGLRPPLRAPPTSSH
jgi:hypothetical protein